MRPLLWLVVGPNGAGKTSYYESRIRPALKAEFVNADLIAATRWPSASERHSADAARLAERRRARLMRELRSFVTETVFSHPGRLELVRAARQAGYEIWVTFVGVERANLAVARVADRVMSGGHDVPEAKIRARYARLAPLATRAVLSADRGFVVDNSTIAAPLRDVLRFERGTLTYRSPNLPGWVRRAFADALSD